MCARVYLFAFYPTGFKRFLHNRNDNDPKPTQACIPFVQSHSNSKCKMCRAQNNQSHPQDMPAQLHGKTVSHARLLPVPVCVCVPSISTDTTIRKSQATNKEIPPFVLCRCSQGEAFLKAPMPPSFDDMSKMQTPTLHSIEPNCNDNVF